MELFMLCAAPIMGAATYRWRGSGWPKTWPFTGVEFSHTVRRASFALVAMAVAWLSLGPWAVLVGPLMWYGLVVGHGSYFPHPEIGFVKDNEQFKFITRLLSDPMDYRTRLLGMALTGFALTLPLGVLYGAVMGPAVGGAVALAGLLKGPIYAMTWPYTAASEWTFGGFVAGILALVALAP